MKYILMLLIMIVMSYGHEMDSTYFRRNVENVNGMVRVSYVNEKMDTIKVNLIPGLGVPYKLDIKDGVVVENPGLEIEFIKKQ